jgi:hypothetical protein
VVRVRRRKTMEPIGLIAAVLLLFVVASRDAEE